MAVQSLDNPGLAKGRPNRSCPPAPSQMGGGGKDKLQLATLFNYRFHALANDFTSLCFRIPSIAQSKGFSSGLYP